MKKFFALVLACLFVISLVACTEAKKTTAAQTKTAAASKEETKPATVETQPAVTDEVKVMSHDEYVAAAIDSKVTVETCVQAKQGWWEDNGVGQASVYTQAEDGAYFLYNLPCSKEDYDKLTVGTRIRVTGTKAEWSGEVEIIEATYEIVDGSFIAQPEDVTALLGTDELIKHQNELVAFKGMTVEAKKDADGNDAAFLYKYNGSGEEGDDLYFAVSLNGQIYNFTVESYLCGPETEVYKAVKALKVGDKIDMTGFLYWYEGANPHITSVTPAA